MDRMEIGVWDSKTDGYIHLDVRTAIVKPWFWLCDACGGNDDECYC